MCIFLAIVPAFLIHELHNVTMPWGDIYEIICEAGGMKSSLEIRVNGGVSASFYFYTPVKIHLSGID